jgi:hypothetical protein
LQIREISSDGKTLESTEIKIGKGIQGDVGLTCSSSLISTPKKNNKKKKHTSIIKFIKPQ